MILIESLTLLIALKFIFIVYLINKKKNIIMEYSFIFCFYDIVIDIANYLIEIPINQRPIWFNIYMGTSLISFFAKIHSLENICCYFLQKKPIQYLKKVSLILALNHLIHYIYLFFKTNFSTDFFPLSIRGKLDIYGTRFSTSIYPLIILAPLMYRMHKKIQSNLFPLLLIKEIKLFFYFGISVKLFFDNIQTSTLYFIKIILEDNSTKFSPFNTFITSLVTFLYMITFYILLKKYEDLENYSIHNDINNHFNKNDNTNFIFHSTLSTIESYSPSNIDIIDKTIKDTIHQKIFIPVDCISLYYTDSLHSNVMEKETELISNILKEEELLNYLRLQTFISLEILEAYIFANSINSKSEENRLYIFLKSQNINFISILKEKENNEIKINGILFIRNNQAQITIENIKFLILITSKLENIYEKTVQKTSFVIKKFKEKKEEDFLKTLFLHHENIINYINHIEDSIEINFFNTLSLHDKQIKEELISNSEKKKLIAIKKINAGNNNIILAAFPEYTKKIISISIPKINSNNNHHCSQFSMLMLRLSSPGKTIYNIFSIQTNEFNLFKNYLISQILTPLNNIITIEKKYHESFFLFYKKIVSQKIHIIDLTEYNNILNFFDQLSNDKEYFFLEKISKEDVIIFKNIDEIDHNNQKKILEYIIHGKHPLGKKYLNIPSKIIFTISHQHHLSDIYQKIIEISEYKKIYNPMLNELTEEQFDTMHNILYNIFHVLNKNEANEDSENYMKKKKYWKENKNIISLFDLFNSINYKIQFEEIINKLGKENRSVLNSELIEQYTKEAAILGKNTLKNHHIMSVLAKKYNQNQIAILISTHRSSISRYFKQQKSKNNDIQ